MTQPARSLAVGLESPSATGGSHTVAVDPVVRSVRSSSPVVREGLALVHFITSESSRSHMSRTSSRTYSPMQMHFSDMEEGLMSNQVVNIYLAVDAAIRSGELIVRSGRRDKEFHFQDWFAARLTQAGINHDVGGRNSYPDFRLVQSTEGFEIKGLAYPGRDATYDCNSQVPTGLHNGRFIYYVFGRYPSNLGEDENEYPVVDLVMCHGDLLNADHEYEHENKSVRGFGSFGDIMIRDRKMYVAPTPYALLEGTTGRRTLVLPSWMRIDDERLMEVGRFSRVEVEEVLIAYEFDLISNELTTKFAPNPGAGTEHGFIAYRDAQDAPGTVSLK